MLVNRMIVYVIVYVIVCKHDNYSSGQPKVTELSIDMYRIGSILEKNHRCLSALKNPIKQVSE